MSLRFQVPVLGMKKTWLTYHDALPFSPASYRAGARSRVWMVEYMPSGRPVRPNVPVSQHPFLTQRKKWCALNVEFNSVFLRFAMLAEFDHVLGVLQQNPLPSGFKLTGRHHSVGRPPGHWLTKLPAKTKSARFRRKLCDWLQQCESIREFQAFYAADPVRLEFEGLIETREELNRAYRKALKAWESAQKCAG